MRGDQLSRVLRFALLFSTRKRGLTVSELAERGGVSIRTVYRDIRVLEQAGYPLYSDGDGGRQRWKLSEGFRATLAIPFTTDELLALHIASKAMPGMSGASFAASLGSAFDKIASTLEEHRRSELARRKDAITIDPGPVRIASTDALLETVQEAIDRCETLSVVYKSPRRKTKSRRLVDPYRLHNAAGSVYLVAFCHLRGELRTFLVDRIRLASHTGKFFAREHEQDAAALYKDAFSSFQGKPRRVRLRFEKAAVAYLRERRWHPSQEIEDCGGGRAFLRLRVYPGPDLEAWIRSWGPLVEVLEPRGLRRRVADGLAAAAGRYGRRAERPAQGAKRAPPRKAARSARAGKSTS